MVQPGVFARGKKNRMNVLPRKFFEATSLPFSSCKVKSGALSWIFMGISPEKSKSMSSAAELASRQPRYQKILYRGSALLSMMKLSTLALLALALPACFSSAAFAQGELSQLPVSDRKAAAKPDLGPRAVAVLQLSSNGKASLVPITILINGKFWDANSYKADPIPMALETGTVYEAERTGNSLGLFTVGSALHSIAVNAPTPWLGTGSWIPAGEAATKAPLKAENAPVGIDKSDQPPRLSRHPGEAAPPSPPPASSKPSTPNSQPSAAPAPSSSPSGSPPSGSPSSDDGPPRLTRGTPSPSPSPSPTSSTPAGSKPSATKPANSKPADTTEADQVPASDSGADEADRPRLRRGKLAAQLTEQEIPGYTKFGVAVSPASVKTSQASAAADQGNIQSIPAISDEHGPQPRSFGFEWLKDEEGEKRQQMVTLAKQQLRAYIAAQAKASIALAEEEKPAAQTAHRATRSKSAKSPDPILDNVQMVAYDLWNANVPIIVFSAEAHLPPPPAGTHHSETNSELRYWITLVAYPDIYNNLHKLYSGVTDKYHLDLTPRLDLIDALDADGDGRGELLFKETSDAGTGWIIYRATGDTLWKMFDSLSPE
jgi:hypothetical protein